MTRLTLILIWRNGEKYIICRPATNLKKMGVQGNEISSLEMLINKLYNVTKTWEHYQKIVTLVSRDSKLKDSIPY